MRTMSALFLEQATRLGDRPALRVLAAGGADADATLSWAEWAALARSFAAATGAAGLRKGSAVAILAGNGLEWPIADLGSMLAGRISVGLYPTSAVPQVAYIIDDCDAALVVVDSAEQLAKVEAAVAGWPEPPLVVAPDRVAAERGSGEAPGASGVLRVLGWSEWLAAGQAALDDGADRDLTRAVEQARPDDIAILIYTSGSTGQPKGAMLTHRCLLASAESVRDTLGLTAADSALSFLPYCHAAERIFGLYTRILCGMECGLVRDHGRIWEAAAAFGPTLFGGLPRFYEKAYESLEVERMAAAPASREAWDAALAAGRRRSRAIRAGRPLEPRAEAAWREAVAPFHARLTALFGGRIRLATSGGAALPADVAEYLDALGLTVLGAYGLTEHLCATFNRPGRYTFDSAGPPMPGTSLRIADDGEIFLRRCPLTFAGYRGRVEATREAFTSDGEWLRTGDLGVLDDRGFLRITGRKKELIALSTGKKVAPVPIEAMLASHPWIAHVMLFGESRKFVTALVTLRRRVVEEWARGAGVDVAWPALIDTPAVRDGVQRAVDRANAGLSRTERVRKFVILDRELSVEEDELTPTLKVRRNMVTARYRERLDALYSGGA